MKKKWTFLKINTLSLTLLLVIGLSFTIHSLPNTKQNSYEQVLNPIKVLDNAVLPDKDKDGIDDFTDIMLGARQDALNMPTYDDRYYSGGYPPNNVGVCADVIWRALMAAGYILRI